MQTMACTLIAIERQRQIEEENRTPEWDVKFNRPNQLSTAGAAYALQDATIWPFSAETYKPSPGNRIRELVKAAALIASEIDRILREYEQ